MHYELALALIDKPGKYATQDPALLPGDHVKLGFCVSAAAPPNIDNEWMWVEVTAVEGDWPDAIYRGELRNKPAYIEPTILQFGSPVEFRAGHIYQVVHDSPHRN
jgi:hypothetical protein